MNLIKFIEELETQNIKLFVEGEQLRYRAPKKVLTPKLLSNIKQYKQNIISLLQESDRTETYPLSQGQRALWFLYKLAPESAAYNLSYVARLQPDLDIQALQQALDRLVERYSILRTTYTTRDDEPIQQVHKNQKILLKVTHAENWSQENLIQWRVQEADQPFNLEQGPVFRMELLLGFSSPAMPILSMTIHHIVFDFWSLEIFLNELEALYLAIKSEQPISLPPLKWNYKDYVRWETEMLAGPKGKQLWSYWQKQLSGELPVLNLPTDRPRPSIQTYKGATLAFDFDELTHQQIIKLSKATGNTPYIFMLAVFKILLRRYTGQTDLLISTPTSGRHTTELQEIIGYFVNPVILRSQLPDNPTFEELLEIVRLQVVDALDHQEYPFGLLVEQLQPNRDPSRSPIAQVGFAWEKERHQETLNGKLGQWVTEVLATEQRGAAFDFTLTFFERSASLSGVLTYNTDLFEESTISRLAGHLKTLVAGALAHPQQRLSQLPLLTEAEQQQLQAWNDTATDYPSEQTIVDLFEQQVEKTPDNIAVVFEEQQLSYWQLNEKANQLAHYLLDIQTPSGTVLLANNPLIAIVVERSLAMVVGLLGILKAGGAYVPIDPTYPPDRIRYMLEDSAAPLLLTQNNLQTQLSLDELELECVVKCLDEMDLVAQPVANPLVNCHVDDLAYVIYTSGSTGKPKGVSIPHIAVVRLVKNTDYIHLDTDDCLAQVSNTSFDAATFEIWGSLLNGAKLVILSKDVALSPPQLAQHLRTHRINTLFLTTALFNQIAQTQPDCFETLKTLLFGGEQVDPYWVTTVLDNSPPKYLLHVYGPTETTTFASWYKVNKIGQVHTYKHTIPIGAPIANTRTYILDTQHQPLPIGIPGELCIAGRGLAREYLNRPELTAEKFIEVELFNKTERIYKTGDLAKWHPDGNLEYLGRIDHQVKLRGFRIELGEIEAVLSQHDAVKDTVVVMQQIDNSKRLIAYITINNGELLIDNTQISIELRDWLKTRLPDYMVPTYLLVLNTLPLTPNGKVDRKALEKQAAEENITFKISGYKAPRTAEEELLTNIWAFVLGLEQVGIHDDFFELGGHSLLATQVMSRIRDTFNTELPLQELFNAPTVAQLSAKLTKTQQQQKSCPPLIAQPRPEQLPLSFAQERLWFLDQLTPDNPFYNSPLALRLSGTLNQEALQRSIDELVKRHETLRTVFINQEGKAYTQILPLPETGVLIEQTDLSAKEQQLQQLISEKAHTPFDLTIESPLRVTLFKLQDDDHVLLITIHHIATDGWSFGVLTRELGAFYNAFVQDKPSPLAPLPIQYMDFTLWQRNWFTGDALEQQQQFWLNKLAEVPIVLELPADHPRPPVHTYHGAEITYQLSTELTTQLKRLSQQHRVTLFMTTLAAFSVVMNRYTGQDQFVIGSPIANRHHQALESLIGFFVNTLALPIDLTEQPTFKTLLQQIRQTTLDAYAHQDLPFERLVDALNLERDMGRSPLVQVMFAVQNAPMEPMALTDLNLTPVNFGAQTVRFDLEVHLWEQDDALTCVIYYYQDIFEAATIERMLAHFEKVLLAVVDDAKQPIHCYSLLTAPEIRQLQTWNQTETDYPKDQTIIALFEQQVEQTPDNIAVVFEGKHLNYLQLNEKANQIAYQLLAHSALKEAHNPLIVICVERSLEMIIGLLAILKAGGAYVPIEPDYPTERINYMLKDSVAALVLTQSRLKTQLPIAPAKVIYLDKESDFANQATTNPTLIGKIQDLAYVGYTSGSTGKPKGVCVPHQAVVRLVKQTNYMEFSEQQVFLQLAPLAFDASTLEIWGSLLNGSELVIMPPQKAALNDIVRAIKTHKVTTLWLTAGLFHLMVDEHLDDLHGLKQLLAGGDVLSIEHIKKVQQHLPECRLINGYGPTENTTFTACCNLSETDFTETAPIGKPIANTRIHILDNHHQPLPVGIAGELCAAGDGLAHGYLNSPELTREKFLEVELFGKRERIYKTGDLARWWPDGHLEFLGRIDNQIKLRGFRIELGEIEATLSQYPMVEQSVVICTETAHTQDKRLIAYIVPTSESETTSGHLLDESSKAFVSQWEQLYNETYLKVSEDTDLAFNLTGWHSSYTGKAIPATEMRVWIDSTVAAIRACNPSTVLEIGCGTGLLLSRIAPHSQTYWGTDFSPVVLQQVEQLKQRQPELAHLVLKQRTADDFSDIQPAQFDTIVLNSVVQYFPSVDYLIKVLEQAIEAIKPGGYLFVGDVRHLSLLRTYHASVQAYQASDDMTQPILRQRVSQQQLFDKELVIDPRLFLILYQQNPRITGVKIFPHRGLAHNELTRFRYQAILEIEHPTSPSTTAVDWQDWGQHTFTLVQLRQQLEKQPAVLGLRGVPNARLESETAIVEWLDNAQITETVGELRQSLATKTFVGLEPEALWQLGEELDYEVDIRWHHVDARGHYEVLFKRRGDKAALQADFPVPHINFKAWHDYANKPLHAQYGEKLVPQLRSYLNERLPEYMIPSAFVLLDALPLNPNGKIDRKALPDPESAAKPGVSEYVAPRTFVEETLARIWAEVLGLERVGIHDNFFELGGHSLLATQIVSRLRQSFEQPIEIAVRALFDAPTVAELAEWISLTAEWLHDKIKQEENWEKFEI